MPDVPTRERWPTGSVSDLRAPPPSNLALPKHYSLFPWTLAIQLRSEQVGFGPLRVSFGRYRTAGVDASQ
jgi:hypothetical protein